MKKIPFAALLLAFLCALNAQYSISQAQGTAFTYQGRLQSGTNFATGKYDVAFSLFSVSSGGVAIAGPVTNAAVGVTNGLFTTVVNFGNVFTGGSNWLEIAVSTNGANAFGTLSPRQQLTPVPYAVFASSISGLSVQQNSSGGPNVALGSTANSITGNIVGATIGGGGATNYAGGGPVSNSVTASFGTVSGGAQNSARDLEAFVGGGYGNTASAQAATVSGGINNTASGLFSTVPGGNGNTASGNYSFAAGHLAQAVNSGSFVWADSQLAFFTSTANDQFLIRAAGGVGIGTATPAKQLDVTGSASGVASGSSIDPSVFVRVNNSATDGTVSSPDYAGIGFGNNTTRQAIVGGTFGNDFLDFYTGGSLTSPKMRIDFAGNVSVQTGNVLVPNGSVRIGSTFSSSTKLSIDQPGGVTQLELLKPGSNLGYQFATDANGLGICEHNIACGRFYIQNGGNIGIGTVTPQLPLDVNSVNYAVPAAQFGVANCGIACGQTNWQEAVRLWNQNINGQVGLGFLVNAGSFNSNAVPGVWLGTAYGAYSVGGHANDFQIATLTNALGSNLVSRVYVNGTSGNVGIGTNSPSTKLEVAGEITCVAVNITSDRNAKEEFKPVNPREVLAKVVGLPITEWQYKSQTDARHIGPMAQDFREAFTLGHDEKHIATVDEGGVALAAIQGLNEKLDEKTQEVETLKQQLAKLTELVNKLAVKQNGAAQ